MGWLAGWLGMERDRLWATSVGINECEGMSLFWDGLEIALATDKEIDSVCVAFCFDTHLHIFIGIDSDKIAFFILVLES